MVMVTEPTAGAFNAQTCMVPLVSTKVNPDAPNVTPVIPAPPSSSVKTSSNWPGPPGLTKVTVAAPPLVQPSMMLPPAWRVGLPQAVGHGVGVLVGVSVGPGGVNVGATVAPQRLVGTVSGEGVAATVGVLAQPRDGLALVWATCSQLVAPPVEPPHP